MRLKIFAVDHVKLLFFFLSQIAKYKYFAGMDFFLNIPAFLVIHALAATRGYLQHTFLTALQHGCQVLKPPDTKHPKKKPLTDRAEQVKKQVKLSQSDPQR